MTHSDIFIAHRCSNPVIAGSREGIMGLKILEQRLQIYKLFFCFCFNIESHSNFILANDFRELHQNIIICCVTYKDFILKLLLHSVAHTYNLH